MFTSWVLSNTTCKDIITWMMSHCRLPVPVATEKWEQLCRAGLGVHAIIQRWKKTVDKDGDLKSDHVLGSNVVNFLKYSYAWVLKSMKWRMDFFYFPAAHLCSKCVYELNNSISTFFHNLLVAEYGNAVLHTEFVDVCVSINRHY